LIVPTAIETIYTEVVMISKTAQPVEVATAKSGREILKFTLLMKQKDLNINNKI
tara:strand:- start:1862 stop:2023 length:162 start_codon:yes stop_codon:yes gene_type:complete